MKTHLDIRIKKRRDDYIGKLKFNSKPKHNAYEIF